MPITITLDPSGPPKRQLIELAFGNLAMTGYEFTKTPEEIADAMVRLDALMYEWPYSELGFAHPTYGTGSAEESSGISYEFMNGVAAALSLRLAAAFGATFTPEATANLNAAMIQLHGKVAAIPTMPMGSKVPRGLGGRGRTNFISEAVEDVNSTEETG